jgi:hypothetical protein
MMENDVYGFVVKGVVVVVPFHSISKSRVTSCRVQITLEDLKFIK